MIIYLPVGLLQCTVSRGGSGPARGWGGGGGKLAPKNGIRVDNHFVMEDYGTCDSCAFLAGTANRVLLIIPSSLQRRGYSSQKISPV